MKGISKLITGATLAMAIALSILLTLILILLFDLYCSLLLNRRHRNKTLTPTQTTTATSSHTSLGTLLAQGVLNAPRNILFPKTPDLEKQDHINQDCTSNGSDRLVYICNPIYENAGSSGTHTPYETPESSPSHLGYSEELSPELEPMEKLQPEACSVSLRDASSLATSPSESETNSKNGVSTTASGSDSTSPSW